STTGSEGSSEGAAGGELNLLEEGQFTTASSGLYKPFSFEEGGELKGFDIDIGNAIAEEMGLEPSPVTTPFETIIQGLNSNRFDAII
ncbi:transporter substrate-binding domain-containing protein, partial [Streptococcus pneumoniae]|nr:transporter substrate-binding domain-containing protein [Streptococcus pneumoniae]